MLSPRKMSAALSVPALNCICGDADGTRQFVVAGVPHIVVYEIEDETITILRIYHMAQDRPGSG